MAKNANIQDFGQKIGGARKDMWKNRCLSFEDLEGMNALEMEKYVQKALIWKKPDYQALVDDGVSKEAALFIKKVYDAIPAKPVFMDPDPINGKTPQEFYIDFVSKVRDTIEQVRTKEDARDAYQKAIKDNGFVRNVGAYSVTGNPGYEGYISNKLLNALQTRWYNLEAEVEKKQFCWSEEEKMLKDYQIVEFREPKVFGPANYCMIDVERDGRPCLRAREDGHTSFFYPSGESVADAMKKNQLQYGTFFVAYKHEIFSINYGDYASAKQAALSFAKAITAGVKEVNQKKQPDRKPAYEYSVMAEVQRDGPEIRERDAEGQDYLDTFKFRGGEFGNWLNQAERQGALNNGFDAFFDLQQTLKIQPEDVSFGGKLSIAFGARGHKGALAHYEPLREVINLTKMKGAGALGHEWFHALDDQIGKQSGCSSLLSKEESWTIQKHSPAMAKLIDTMRRKKVPMPSNAQQQKIDQAVKKLHQVVDMYIPESYCKIPEQRAKRTALIETLTHFCDDINTLRYLSGEKKFGDDPTLETLKLMRKECGFKADAKGLTYIASAVSNLSSVKNYAPEFVTVETDFLKQSKAFDKNYAKSDKGYWASETEMLARAFACYLADKAPYRSDYLNGLSEDGPVPQGEERIAINAAIDELIAEVKERGILHEATPEQMLTVWKAEGKLPAPALKEEHHQMSIEDLIAAASEPAEPMAASKPAPVRDDESR